MSLNFLVADTSAATCNVVRMAFENKDIAVESVEDGDQLLEKMAQLRPDMVLVDTQIPPNDGYELTRKIKDHPEYESVPVVLFVGESEGVDNDLFESSGADGYLIKPFKSADIIAKAGEFIELPTKPEEAEEPMAEAEPSEPPPPTPAPLKLSLSDIVEEPEELPEMVPMDSKGTNLDLEEPEMEAPPPVIEAEEPADEEPVVSLADEIEDLAPDDAIPFEDAPMEPVADAPEPQDDAIPLETATTAGVPDDEQNEGLPEDAIPLEDVLAELVADEPEPQDDTIPLDTATTADIPEDEISEDLLDAIPLEDMPEDAPAEPVTHATEPEPEDDAIPLEDVLMEQDLDEKLETGIDPLLSEENDEPDALLEDAFIPGGTGVIDDIVEDLDSLLDMGEPDEEDFPVDEDSLAEIDLDDFDSAGELDDVFQSIQTMERENAQPNRRKDDQLEEIRDMASAQEGSGPVAPEPEDLLERMAPSAFPSRPEGPDLVQESIDFISKSDEDPEHEEEPAPEAANGGSEPTSGEVKAPDLSSFSSELDGQIQKILETSLNDALQKELTGLADTIARSVKEIAREVVPRVAREIIREEIKKIKNAERA